MLTARTWQGIIPDEGRTEDDDIFDAEPPLLSPRRGGSGSGGGAGGAPQVQLSFGQNIYE
jgi:hypothetical protein